MSNNPDWLSQAEQRTEDILTHKREPIKAFTGKQVREAVSKVTGIDDRAYQAIATILTRYRRYTFEDAGYLGAFILYAYSKNEEAKPSWQSLESLVRDVIPDARCRSALQKGGPELETDFVAWDEVGDLSELSVFNRDSTLKPPVDDLLALASNITAEIKSYVPEESQWSKPKIRPVKAKPN